MRRCLVGAVLALALLPAAAGAQQTAAAPERWFAIAWERGARLQMGPFPSLDACEQAREARAQRAYERRRTPGGDYASGNAALSEEVLWGSSAICQRF